MTGYINLYAPELRRRRTVVSAAQAGLALALALAAMLGWTAYARHAAGQAAGAAQALETELKQRREQLTALTKAAAARQPDAALTAEIAQAEALLARRQAVLASLDGGVLGDTEGFSRFMRALARQALDGLWLTGFDIARGGGEMRIAGRALSAELLPRYIGRLNGEAVFQGREFAALSLTEPPPAAASAAAKALPQLPAVPSFLEFSLASAGAAAGRETHR